MRTTLKYLNGLAIAYLLKQLYNSLGLINRPCPTSFELVKGFTTTHNDSAVYSEADSDTIRDNSITEYDYEKLILIISASIALSGIITFLTTWEQ